MKFVNYSNIYFLGIGGIGMSALALYFKNKGCHVSGYDRTSSNITDKLIQAGIDVHFSENINLIPSNVDVVIYTPAIPPDNIEFKYFKEKQIPLFKRSDILSMITQDKYTVAVAGTHGKTSITSMIAHILNYAGKNIEAFIGGLSKNFSSNFLYSPNPEMIVVEADEFDHSFLKLNPDIAVITFIDPDHLDIYNNYYELHNNFNLFVNKIKPNGILLHKDDLILKYPENINVFKYSLENNNLNSNFTIDKLKIINNKYFFDIKLNNIILKDVTCGVPGLHNVENAIAAAAVCYMLKISPDVIKKAISDYKGVERRFDFRIITPEIIYVDDYAHHPAEINACLNSLKQLYPDRKLTVVFQPHLYTRTKDLLNEFANSLQQADEVILLDIYPAREKPIEGVTSALLLSKIEHNNKKLLSKKELISYLKKSKPQLLVTMGAGDIDKLVKPIEEQLKNEIIK